MCRGRLIDFPAFQVHDAVLKDIDVSDPVPARDFVKVRYQLGQFHSFAVNRHRNPLFKGQLNGFGLIRSLFGHGQPHPNGGGKLLVQIYRSRGD